MAINSPYQFDPSILRAYDIRGVVGKTLNPLDMRMIGRSFATILHMQGQNQVCIGYDGRLSSPDLEKAMVQGLVEGGMVVHRVGLGPTPMVYFAMMHLDCDACLVITGSHNPPQYNGVKLAMRSGPVYGEAIKEIGAISDRGDYVIGEGKFTHHDLRQTYLDHLLSQWDPPQNLSVVWDCGNGATGEIVSALTQKISGKHYCLFHNIDGRFPHHHPDPTEPENLVALQQKMQEVDADIGIAFDGDGDRIGVVDDQGQIIFGDQILAILARDVLKANPGATIIADVKSSQTVFDDISAHGGAPLMWKTGHSLIKAKMLQTGAKLAGEMSGHVFFADNYGFDDAIYAAIKLINILKNGRKLSDLRAELPQTVSTPEIRLTVSEDKKFLVMKEVAAYLDQQNQEVIDLDGVRVNSEDGWWLVRASNTQNALVLRAESKDQGGLERLTTTIKSVLHHAGIEENWNEIFRA